MLPPRSSSIYSKKRKRSTTTTDDLQHNQRQRITTSKTKLTSLSTDNIVDTPLPPQTTQLDVVNNDSRLLFDLMFRSIQQHHHPQHHRYQTQSVQQKRLKTTEGSTKFFDCLGPFDPLLQQKQQLNQRDSAAYMDDTKKFENIINDILLRKSNNRHVREMGVFVKVYPYREDIERRVKRHKKTYESECSSDEDLSYIRNFIHYIKSSRKHIESQNGLSSNRSSNHNALSAITTRVSVDGVNFIFLVASNDSANSADNKSQQQQKHKQYEPGSIVSYIATYTITTSYAYNDDMEHRATGVWYGLHSYTPPRYAKKGFNSLLRSIFILSAPLIRVKINRNSHTTNHTVGVDFVGSNAVNPISRALWDKLFHINTNITANTNIAYGSGSLDTQTYLENFKNANFVSYQYDVWSPLRITLQRYNSSSSEEGSTAAAAVLSLWMELIFDVILKDNGHMLIYLTFRKLLSYDVTDISLHTILSLALMNHNSDRRKDKKHQQQQQQSMIPLQIISNKALKEIHKRIYRWASKQQQQHKQFVSGLSVCFGFFVFLLLVVYPLQVHMYNYYSFKKNVSSSRSDVKQQQRRRIIGENLQAPDAFIDPFCELVRSLFNYLDVLNLQKPNRRNHRRINSTDAATESLLLTNGISVYTNVKRISDMLYAEFPCIFFNTDMKVYKRFDFDAMIPRALQNITTTAAAAAAES